MDQALTGTMTRAPSRHKDADSTSSSTWKPILEGDEMTHAQTALCAIARQLANTSSDMHELANGTGGIALAIAYLSDLEAIDGWRTHVTSMLSGSIEAALVGDAPRSFLHGAAGLVWAWEHLCQHYGLPYEESVGQRVDAVLREQLTHASWCGVYELSHGLVGYGVYSSGGVRADERRELLERVVTRLETTALPMPGGVAWWTPPQNISPIEYESYPEGYFNLGLAHGIPSVIAILGSSYYLGVARPSSRRLIPRATNWLLSKRQPASVGSHFRDYLPLSGRAKLRRTRIAWCFGDLGVSAALYATARNVNDPALAQSALEVARDVAQRDPSTASVTDAGICHGAAGNAHIFNRLYQETNEAIFLKASRYWFARTLAFYDQAQTATEVSEDEKVAWPTHPGFFGGLAGIGLALQAAISSRVPAWDHMLLISPLAKATQVAVTSIE